MYEALLVIDHKSTTTSNKFMSDVVEKITKKVQCLDLSESNWRQFEKYKVKE